MDAGAATRTTGRFVVTYLPATLLLVGLVVGWEVYVRVADTRPFILPPPSRIWDAFVRTRETLAGHTWSTLTEALIGIGIGTFVGVVLAAMIASLALIRRVLYPLLIVSQTIPMIVLAPLLVIWFGLGMTPKIVVVALITFFPVVVSTSDALLNADRDLIAMVRSMGANRLQVLRTVLIPSAIPALFAGLKISAAYAVGAAVVAEWVGSDSGIGVYINRSTRSFQTDQIFVAVAVIALLSMALFAAVHMLNRIVAPWMYAQEDNK